MSVKEDTWVQSEFKDLDEDTRGFYLERILRHLQILGLEHVKVHLHSGREFPHHATAWCDTTWCPYSLVGPQGCAPRTPFDQILTSVKASDDALDFYCTQRALVQPWREPGPPGSFYTGATYEHWRGLYTIR